LAIAVVIGAALVGIEAVPLPATVPVSAAGPAPAAFSSGAAIYLR